VTQEEITGIKIKNTCQKTLKYQTNHLLLLSTKQLKHMTPIQKAKILGYGLLMALVMWMALMVIAVVG
jgi:hypothetical protein